MTTDCYKCGFWSTGGCTCDPQEMWTVCPIENKAPENIIEMQQYIERLKTWEDQKSIKINQ